jgi:hypothetical protein
MAGELGRNLFHAKVHCPDHDKRIAKYLAHVTVEKFGVTAHGWLFKSGAPFVKRFSTEIETIIEGTSNFKKIYITDIFFKEGCSRFGNKTYY